LKRKEGTVAEPEKAVGDVGEVEIPEVLVPEVITPEQMHQDLRLARLQPKLLPQIAEYLQNPERGEQLLTAYRDLVKTLRLTSIHLTYPSDWVLNVVRNEDRIITTGYLQDIGAERAALPWGISRLGGILDRREHLEDKTYIWYCKADFLCERTGVVLSQVEGARWSGDDFYQKRAAKAGGMVNPLWVKQGALRNMHGKAVRSLAGLAGVPEEELKAAGLDTTKCVVVRWGGAGAAAREGEISTRGKTARDDLFGLLKARAEANRTSVPKVLRELCKTHGIAEKDSVAQLTDSQTADLLVLLREEASKPKPEQQTGGLPFGEAKP
jgi:hypothetical protein